MATLPVKTAIPSPTPLRNLTVEKLKDLLREHGVRGYSGKRKDELIAMVEKAGIPSPMITPSPVRSPIPSPIPTLRPISPPRAISPRIPMPIVTPVPKEVPVLTKPISPPRITTYAPTTKEEQTAKLPPLIQELLQNPDRIDEPGMIEQLDRVIKSMNDDQYFILGSIISQNPRRTMIVDTHFVTDYLREQAKKRPVSPLRPVPLIPVPPMVTTYKPFFSPPTLQQTQQQSLEFLNRVIADPKLINDPKNVQLIKEAFDKLPLESDIDVADVASLGRLTRTPYLTKPILADFFIANINEHDAKDFLNSVIANPKMLDDPKSTQAVRLAFDRITFYPLISILQKVDPTLTGATKLTTQQLFDNFVDKLRERTQPLNVRPITTPVPVKPILKPTPTLIPPKVTPSVRPPIAFPVLKLSGLAFLDEVIRNPAHLDEPGVVEKIQDTFKRFGSYDDIRAILDQINAPKSEYQNLGPQPGSYFATPFIQQVKQRPAPTSFPSTILENPRSGCTYEEKGRRPEMEDAHLSAEFTFGDITGTIYGVFDGHAGSSVAFQLANGLPDLIATYLKANMNEALVKRQVPGGTEENQIKSALQNVFIDFDRKLEETFKSTHGGSTAIVAVVIGTKIYLVNLGDSRGVVFDSLGKILLASKDHKPGDPAETARIQKAGGHVSTIGIPRVNGTLAVSRAFGDFYLKRSPQGVYMGVNSIVSPVPDVTVVNIAKHPEKVYILLACDGLWDVFSNQDAVDTVLTGVPTVSCERLVKEAIYQRNSNDNVTVLIASV